MFKVLRVLSRGRFALAVTASIVLEFALFAVQAAMLRSATGVSLGTGLLLDIIIVVWSVLNGVLLAVYYIVALCKRARVSPLPLIVALAALLIGMLTLR